MIFLRHIKYPSNLIQTSPTDDPYCDPCARLPEIMPRSGMGFYIIDMFQVEHSVSSRNSKFCYSGFWLLAGKKRFLKPNLDLTASFGICEFKDLSKEKRGACIN